MAAICAPVRTVKNWALGNKTKFSDTHGGEIKKECQRELCLNLATAYLTKYPKMNQKHPHRRRPKYGRGHATARFGPLGKGLGQRNH